MIKHGRIMLCELQDRFEQLYVHSRLDDSNVDYDQMYQLYVEASNVVRSTIGVKEQLEWNAYGCGDASFLDSWYYIEDSRFKLQPYGDGKRFTGVTILYSLLEPMFCAYESEAEWREDGGGSHGLPAVSLVDEYRSKDVRVLSRRICSALREFGIPQVSRKTLEHPIYEYTDIESNLTDGSLKLFDAFYHWLD